MPETDPESPFRVAPDAPVTEPFADRPVPPRAGSRKRKLSIKLNSDGLIDWQGDGADALVAVLAEDKEAAEHIKLLEVEALPEITEENVKAILSIIGKVDAWVLRVGIARTMKLNLDADLAAQLEFKKEQLDALAPPGARIANRYLPLWAKQYQDIVVFASLMVHYTTENMKVALITQLTRNAQKQHMATVAPAPAVEMPPLIPKEPTNHEPKVVAEQP